eukprot:TRINITY_DN5572_c0_g1_i1.p1 TRINITY_DN5572_c0_g1~~TRINITY_DN5572_c0_g1_i1.p1  ORF type:complete len:689 (+),score=124.17 TRINITY_DN5572_c0_g1_i1:180-2246(+)
MAPKRQSQRGGLSAERKRELQEMFNGVDKDGNGQLSFHEVAALLREGNPSLTDKEVAMLFSKIDADGDLKVNMKEFARYVQAAAPGSLAVKTEAEKSIAERAKQELKRLDANGDNRLSLDELTVLLRKGNPGISDKEVKLLFAAIDKDDSNSIEFDEFVDFISGKTTQEMWALEEVPWSVKVPIPKVYRERQSTISKPELRGVTMQQVNDLHALVIRVLQAANISDDTRRLTMEVTNMYHISDHFVMPLTLRFRCSFVELCSEGPEEPTWFVSHWWGTAFSQSVQLLKFHIEKRQIPKTAAFWVDAFANCLHAALEPVNFQAPFANVIQSNACLGTVALVDSEGEAFGRVWCNLEAHVSLTLTQSKSEKHIYDVVAWNDHLQQASMLVQIGPGKVAEVGEIPRGVYAKGIKTTIEKGHVTRPEDKRRILNLIVGTPEAQLDRKVPPKDSHAYNELNRDLRERYAAGAIYMAALHGDEKHLKRHLADYGEHINTGVGLGRRAIHAAVDKEDRPHINVLNVLLQASANPDVTREDGSTALLLAATEGFDDPTALLLRAQADPDIPRHDGLTPLHMAIHGDHITIAGALLDAKANVEGSATAKETPLCLAARKDQAATCSLLLDMGADASKPDSAGKIPSHYAKRSSKLYNTLTAATGASGARKREPSLTDKEMVAGLEKIAQGRATRGKP